jgi:hypothetical protein
VIGSTPNRIMSCIYIYVYIHYCVYHNINIISILLRIICDWLHVRHLCK